MWLILALISHLTAGWYFRRSRPWLLWAAAAISLGTTFLWMSGSIGEAELRRPVLIASVPFLLGLVVHMQRALSQQNESQHLWRAQSDRFADGLARRFAYQLGGASAPERERLLAEFPTHYRASIAERLRSAELSGVPIECPADDLDVPVPAAGVGQEPHDPLVMAALFALTEMLLHAGTSLFPPH